MFNPRNAGSLAYRGNHSHACGEIDLSVVATPISFRQLATKTGMSQLYFRHNKPSFACVSEVTKQNTVMVHHLACGNVLNNTKVQENFDKRDKKKHSNLPA
jgi:hypothetical protein